MLAAGFLALATAAAASAAVPPGDAYLCYKAALAAGQPKFTPAQKTLQDQFGTLVVDVKGFAVLCNPTQTAAYPAVHAVGYKIAPAKTTPPQAKFVAADHTAFDQFGTHPLTVVKPVEVRAPSAKVLGAGGTGPVDTTGVDHFECYKAAPAKGAPKFVPPPPLPLTDEFGTQSYTLTKITRLCTPVNKNGEDATAPQHVGHLVCYQAKLPAGTKFAPQTVSVNNANFGPAVLVAKAVLEVCVPAFKDTVPSTTTSTIPTTTSTIATTTSITTSTTTTTTLQTSCSALQPCLNGAPCCAGTCIADDQECVNTCSVTTSQACATDADCRFPKCPSCGAQASNQTCVQHPRTRYCGAGTCVRWETCCLSSGNCCTNDQVCRSDGACITTCTNGETPCGNTCCNVGEFCDGPTTTCRVACGFASCSTEGQTCCFGTCCNTATHVCGPSSGTPCVARRTCTGTDVYIPTTDYCCPQQAACGGNNQCCNLVTQHCDAASGTCLPN